MMGTGNGSVVLTGATRGIGAATASLLSDQGWHVIGIARNKPDEFEGSFYKCDIQDRAQREKVFKAIATSHSVQAVINNVGAARIQDTGEVTHDALDEMWQVNFEASVDLVQKFLPSMKDRKWGRIISIASGAILGKPGRVGYAATKAALLGMTRTMAIDLAEDGITANVVAPGQIETELFLANNPPDDPRTIKNLQGIPSKRLGKPEEVAHAIAFFLSKEAGYVTGQTLYVCGGLTVGKSPI